MPLSDAERQKRFRKERNRLANAAKAGEPACGPSPDVSAWRFALPGTHSIKVTTSSLPDSAEGWRGIQLLALEILHAGHDENSPLRNWREKSYSREAVTLAQTMLRHFAPGDEELRATWAFFIYARIIKETMPRRNERATSD